MKILKKLISLADARKLALDASNKKENTISIEKQEDLVLAEEVCDCCHSMCLNMNDVFAPAADCYIIDSFNLSKLLPLVKKYGFSTFVAYVSIKRSLSPWRSSPKYFKEARKEILLIKDTLHFDWDEDQSYGYGPDYVS